jgi:hypothetical protein
MRIGISARNVPRVGGAQTGRASVAFDRLSGTPQDWVKRCA